MTAGVPGGGAQLLRKLNRDLLGAADHHLRNSVAILYHVWAPIRERVHRDENLSPVVAVYRPKDDEHTSRGKAGARPYLHIESAFELHRKTRWHAHGFLRDLQGLIEAGIEVVAGRALGGAFWKTRVCVKTLDPYELPAHTSRP